MIVYRIESEENDDKSGRRGAYNFSATIDAAYHSSHLYKSRHDPRYDERYQPSPADDRGLSNWWNRVNRSGCSITREIVRSYHCGFISEEQMLAWFCPESFRYFVEWNQQNEARLVISLYEVDGRSVRKGDWQCMFIRSKAILVEQRDPGYYYSELEMAA